MLQKFCVDEISIKQEQLDEPCGGSMQKVPSLSDLSDPESSLGKLDNGIGASVGV